jgi:hypothetical protein
MMSVPSNLAAPPAAPPTATPSAGQMPGMGQMGMPQMPYMAPPVMPQMPYPPQPMMPPQPAMPQMPYMAPPVMPQMAPVQVTVPPVSAPAGKSSNTLLIVIFCLLAFLAGGIVVYLLARRG